jgi:energy-coupling factor transport system substrate-specific component
MKKIFKKFQVKDFVFLAVLSAAMTLCGGITMPLVMHTTVFGLRNMAAAPIYSIFVAIGLMKVRKPGALTIIGLFSGAPLIFFSTVMFFNNFVSAIIAELIMLLIFRGYQKKVSVFVTTGIYMPFSLPISVLFSLWLNGQSYEQLKANPTMSILTSLGTVTLAFLGSAIGMKIANELQKAGKLKPYGEENDV